MEAYRDQYATLFHNGEKVVLVGISADADTTLASWAAEKNAPFRFAADPEGKVIRQYGAWNEEGKYANRHTVIVGPDGKIAFEQRPFRVTSQEAYTALGEAVDKLAPKGR
ncbi:MAG: redoxin domain-containing protein [Gemmatimonadetes bacterium]|nr:redoxin domain-containing protein [Gemmatimonadota bacterium]